jgi:DNA-binding NarL/FixJ family response regulator
MTSQSSITVVIIDDHPIVRAGMRSVLERVEDIRVLAEGESGADALELVNAHAPQVLVLDVNLPDFNGLEVTCRLQKQGGETAVLALTAHDDAQTVFGLLESGAVGYVLKDEALETLAHAVRAAAGGESWLSPSVAQQVIHRAVGAGRDEKPPLEKQVSPLTPREQEVLGWLAKGLDNTAIAETLTITKRTVQNHVSNIYSKLDVGSRTEAMLYAIKRGWVDVGPEGEALDDD